MCLPRLQPPASALFLLLAVGSFSSAQQTLFGVRKVNSPLTRANLADLKEARITADGSLAVYRADLDTDEVFELFASPMDGSGGVRKLSRPVVSPGGEVWNFELAPGAGRVVYLGSLLQAGSSDLFSCALDGSRTVRLNASLPPDGDVVAYRISPDGTRVAYVADQNQLGVFELFGVPTDRSLPPARLSAPLFGGRDVLSADFAFTPDGSRVVYVADQDTNDVLELYSSDGFHAPVKLNPPLVAGGDIGGSLSTPRLAITADGARVVYLADQAVDEVTELYSVTVDGSQAAVRISATLAFGDRVLSFRVSDDGYWAVYQALNAGLFSVPTDGSAPALAIGDRPYQDSRLNYGIDPGSSTLVYLRPRTGNLNDLYSVPLDGSHGQVSLSPPMTNIGSVYSFRFDPAGQRLVCRFAPASASNELAMVPIDGSAPAVVLSTPGHGAVEVQTYAITGTTVAYISDQDQDEVDELFGVPIDGSALPVRLCGTLPQWGDVGNLQAAPDGSRVLYLADQETDTVYEYFSVPPTGGSAPVRVNDPLPPGPIAGDVYGYQFSPQTGRVVYIAGVLDTAEFELRSVPLDGSEPSVRLDRDTEGSTNVNDVTITPDGTRVVHARGGAELYCEPIDGSAPTTELAQVELLFGSFISVDPLVSPDSTRVVYRSHSIEFFPNSQHYGTLYGVRLDGSESPYVISPASVTRYAITPDSARIVYQRGRELYSRALDASSAEVRLDGPTVPNGGVAGFQLTPDGTNVLYTADQETDGLTELYSVRIDRSTPPLKLNAPTDGAGVSWPLVTADSLRAVWVQADAGSSRLYVRLLDGSEAPRSLTMLGPLFDQLQLTPGNRALYFDGQDVGGQTDRVLRSAPLDGSAAPVDLGPALGSAANLRVSPDGEWAAYESGDLFAVRTNGSATAHRLDTLGAHAGHFVFTPDSHAIVFDAPIAWITGLFGVRVESSEPAQRLNASMVSGGDVDDFLVVPSSGLEVLYRADGEVDGVRELFAARARLTLRAHSR